MVDCSRIFFWEAIRRKKQEEKWKSEEGTRCRDHRAEARMQKVQRENGIRQEFRGRSTVKLSKY